MAFRLYPDSPLRVTKSLDIYERVTKAIETDVDKVAVQVSALLKVVKATMTAISVAADLTAVKAVAAAFEADFQTEMDAVRDNTNGAAYGARAGSDARMRGSDGK